MNGNTNDNNEDEEEEFYDSETEPVFVEPKTPQTNNNFMPSTPISPHLSGSFLSSDKTPNNRSYTPIYAVQFLNKGKSQSSNVDNSQNRIFINQENAMKLCKQDPDNRRFKVFRNFLEAYAFSYEIEIESGQAPSIAQVQANLNASNSIPIKDNVQTVFSSIDSPMPNGNNIKIVIQSPADVEKLLFSAPKKPEINQLRLFIETNKFEIVRDKIISNPRFLISAGDAPVIYQEAFRYNCLHVCAKENRHEICQLILNLLSNPAFIQKLYRNDASDDGRNRIHHLLDLYINMPEKGLNETPLHFASKYGSYEVCRLLMSFDFCSKKAMNKNNKTPEDIICTKATTPAAKENFNLIKSLFEDIYYVPLYRDDDKGDVIVDKPSPKLVSSLNAETNDTSNTKSPLKMNLLNQNQRKLAGYVGPVSPTVANDIYDRLRTSSRLRQSPVNVDLLRSDDQKGYERILRKICEDMNLPWYEYWAFLDSYCNLKTSEGVRKLEIYLKQKKFVSILDQQLKSIQIILNDQMNMKADDRTLIISKLYTLQEIIELVKTSFDVKENSNILSRKFERFVNNTGNLMPLDETEGFVDDLETIKADDNILNTSIANYMTNIIELSRIDKSSKCYFNLYKLAKTLLDVVDRQKSYENFYLSPLFKRLASCKINQLSLMKSVVELDEIRKSIDFDSDDDEDKAKEVNENNNLGNSDDKVKMYDAEESYLDEYKPQENDEDDIMNYLAMKMQANCLNGDTPVKEEKSKRRSCSFLTVNNKENENSLQIMNKELDSATPNYSKYAQKLQDNDLKEKNMRSNRQFMYGDTPSKLDRAVFLAIQGISIDPVKYSLLYEWYNYIKNCNQTEMQQWRTPIKPNPRINRTGSGGIFRPLMNSF